MIYTIHNAQLSVSVDDHGAQLSSVKSADETEYLWQKDPQIWRDQAPNIFPYVARLTRETYTFEGQEYHLTIHGFIRHQDLHAEQISDKEVVFSCESSEEIRQVYPFDFVYRIAYLLEENTLHITTTVQNTGDKKMFFGLGGHPGFNVPMEEGLTFEDYQLEFSAPCHPTRSGFTPDCFLNGKDELYPLEDDRIIRLHHDLFDDDAIVLKHVDHTVALRSDKGSRSVTVSFPDYPVIGFWHKPKTTAPYVCIEPWSSLPARKDIVEDFGQQADLIGLEAGKTYTNHWTITIR